MYGYLDFLVIGAQKCATSWLYYCLREHPELHLPPKKREVEYLGGDLFASRGAEWYFSLFRDAKAGQKRGAVSVEYLNDPRAPEAVRRYAPEVKFIVSLRDPIDRAKSAHNWYLRKKSIPFEDVETSLTRALDLGPRIESDRYRKIYQDIISRGYYDIQLERFLNFFEPGQFLFVLYEDIHKNPLSVLRKVYDFIGVQAGFEPPSFSSRPKQSSSFKPMIQLERMFPRSRMMGKTIDIVSQYLGRIYGGESNPDLPEPLFQALVQAYRQHVYGTRRIIRHAPPDNQPLSTDILQVWNPRWKR